MQVLLPLKEFAAAKQRLSGLLSAAERAHLFQAMVEDVLGVLTTHADIERVVVCSRDHSAQWLASHYDIEFLDESMLGANDLNSAVNTAAQRLAAEGCDDLLVVHGDLPLLSVDDISSFLAQHRRAGATAVTMAPDRRRSGTNLLAWRPLPLFSVCYGVDSFALHCAQARQLEIEPTICDLSGARCDIDEPEDLLFLIAQPGHTAAVSSLAFLRDNGIAARLHAMQRGANSVDDRDTHHTYGRDSDCA